MTAHWRTPAGLHTSPARLPVEGELPSFDGATGWLNSAPLTAADLRGKIILVNFWTYTCINWLRQLPYLRAWAGKYADHGLVVIGVHTPEFAFEHDLGQRPPRRARHADRLPGRDRQRLRGLARLRQPLLARPVLRRRAGAHPASPLRRRRIPAVGNGHPATAGRGGIRPTMVMSCVGRRPRPGGPGRLGQPAITGDLHRLRAHRELRVPRRRVPGKPHAILSPGAAAAQPLGPIRGLDDGGTGRHAERGRRADRLPLPRPRPHLVMGPAAPGTAGAIPGAHRRAAARRGARRRRRRQGHGTVAEQRLYQLIRQPGPITDRTFEITFLDPGAQAYSFTFG